MVFAYYDLLQISVFAFVVILAAVFSALLVSISFHEFSHAFMANSLGDPTPRSLGRLSLNPAVHLAPMGTLLLLVGGFGWGKPVPFNPRYMTNAKVGTALVAAAGPLSNFLMAVIFSLPVRAGLVPRVGVLDVADFFNWQISDYFGLFFTSLVTFNLLLGVFNLIPLAPLDGFKVAVGALPGELSRAFARTEPWGMGILFLLFALPFVTGVSILSGIMLPLVDSASGLLLGS